MQRALLQNYRIDATHSNGYTVRKQMGSPQQPTTKQYARLSADERLQLLDSPQRLKVSDGAVRISTTLPRQSVSLALS